MINGKSQTIGQSYKHFTILNYDPRVIIWTNFKSYNSIVVNYDRKVCYKIDHWGWILNNDRKSVETTKETESIDRSIGEKMICPIKISNLHKISNSLRAK